MAAAPVGMSRFYTILGVVAVVGIGLLGYGTVGAAVDRLLTESADDIERATRHRLRVVKALVRDLGKERAHPPGGGVLTTSV